jgi:uncharacterized membrane protein YfcA
MSNEFAAYGASLSIGLSLGLIGAGGSILTVPVFVYILNKDPLSSSVYSMFVVGISTVAGSIQSVIHKLADFKTMLLFGIPSITGVLVARKIIMPSIADHITIGSIQVTKEALFMYCLSVIMFFAGIRMLRPIAAEADCKEKTPAKEMLLLYGLCVGIITGLLGIGGGFLIVPALYFFARLPMKTAIATAFFIITANSSISFLSSYQAVDLDWVLLAKFSSGTIAGIIAGIKLSSKIESNHLKKIFGLFVLCVAMYVLVKTLA